MIVEAASHTIKCIPAIWRGYHMSDLLFIFTRWLVERLGIFQNSQGLRPHFRVKLYAAILQGHQCYQNMYYISLDQWRFFCSSVKFSHIVNHYDDPNFWICNTLLRNILVIYPISLQYKDDELLRGVTILGFSSFQQTDFVADTFTVIV